jgi:hypothetical protein
MDPDDLLNEFEQEPCPEMDEAFFVLTPEQLNEIKETIHLAELKLCNYLKQWPPCATCGDKILGGRSYWTFQLNEKTVKRCTSCVREAGRRPTKEEEKLLHIEQRRKNDK